MIIPYRVKNPPKHFPVATVTLIALNVLVFAITSERFLYIRRPIVEQYALSYGASPLYTFFTSMFLHGDIRHLIGNMLFLWIFGPAVEDRLRIPGYLGLYFLAGLAGDVAQAALSTATGILIPGIGASGCIMGLLGAYWYVFPWSTVCVFYLFWFWIKIWYGVFEIAAVWVIGAYFFMDLAFGFIGHALEIQGGVANFAHVGGALTGAVLMWGLGMKRDTSEVSQIKATQADIKDANYLTVSELKPLVSFTPDDEELLVKYTNKAREDGTPDDIKFALDTNLRVVVTRCTEAAVYYLTMYQGQSDIFSPGDLVFMGRWCESNSRPEQATALYGIVESSHPESRELEMAMFRTACVYWFMRRDGKTALEKLEQLLTRFPSGAQMFEAEDLRDMIKREMDGSRAA